MRRGIALLLAVLMMLTGCTQQTVQNPTPETSTPTETEISSEPTSETEQTTNQVVPVFAEDVEPNFTTLSDPSQLHTIPSPMFTSDTLLRNWTPNFRELVTSFPLEKTAKLLSRNLPNMTIPITE